MDDPEAVIEEARARQRHRRRRALLAALSVVAAGGCAYGISQGISNGKSAPACAPGGCASGAASHPSTGTSVALYGIFQGSTRRISLGPHAYTQIQAARLVRVDPRTLKPLGKRLGFADGFTPLALSPNNNQLLGTNTSSSRSMTVVDLRGMRVDAKVNARIDAEIGQRTVMAAWWPTANRVLALVQTFSKPYQRSVLSRSLIAFDPASGRIVWERTLPVKLGLFDAQTVQGTVVLQLVDSRLKSTRETLVIASPNGQLRTGNLNIPHVSGPFQVATLMTSAGSSPAAYLVSDNDTIFSINLDNAHSTPHHVNPPTGAPSTPQPKYNAFPVAAALGGNIVATGLFTRNDETSRGGLYLIDPTNWTARLLDPNTPRFISNGSVLATFGNVLGSGSGSGVTLYNQTGTPTSHLYGAKTLMEIALTPTVGYAFAPTLANPTPHRPIVPNISGGQELLFNPSTGKSVGRTPQTRGNAGSAPQLIYPGAPALNRNR